MPDSEIRSQPDKETNSSSRAVPCIASQDRWTSPRWQSPRRAWHLSVPIVAVTVAATYMNDVAPIILDNCVDD
jgi:hypothetical protein